MAAHFLVCPFLTDDPAFAHGVEFGLLRARMASEDCITDYFLIDNQEQITLLANRLGWVIEKMEPWGTGWFRCVLSKSGKPT